LSGAGASSGTRETGGAGAGAARPAITIVTVCRNALHLLRPTVESVLGQGSSSVEYWIVDGGSTDGTREFLAVFSRRGVRTVSEPDRGIADAMNKGVRLSAGSWIAHLHAGDTYLPGALDHVLPRTRGRTDVLCGSIVKQEERGETLYHPNPSRLRMDMTIHHPAVFTRREVFEEIADERDGLIFGNDRPIRVPGFEIVRQCRGFTAKASVGILQDRNQIRTQVPGLFPQRPGHDDPVERDPPVA